MKNPLLGAFLGLVAGSILGSLLAFAVHRTEQNAPPEDAGWANFPPLGQVKGPVVWQRESVSAPLNYLLFQGILLGGGFGSLVGAISAATGVILRTREQTR